MSENQYLKLTLPDDLASFLASAEDTGAFGSSQDIIREALGAWKLQHAARMQALLALKADIDIGMADAAAGRVQAFDVVEIIAQGRLRSSQRRAQSV